MILVILHLAKMSNKIKLILVSQIDCYISRYNSLFNVVQITPHCNLKIHQTKNHSLGSPLMPRIIPTSYHP